MAPLTGDQSVPLPLLVVAIISRHFHVVEDFDLIVGQMSLISLCQPAG